jgi:hypothetical protein
MHTPQELEMSYIRDQAGSQFRQTPEQDIGPVDFVWLRNRGSDAMPHGLEDVVKQSNMSNFCTIKH